MACQGGRFRVDEEFHHIAAPSIAGRPIIAFEDMPSTAQPNGLPVDDIVRHSRLTPNGIHRITPPTRVHTELVRLAVRQLRFERRLEGHIRLDIMAIDAVQTSGLQPSRREVVNQLSREDDVDIGCKNEPSARTTDTNILRDHLEQRQHVRVPQPLMQGGRDLNEPVLAEGRMRQAQQSANMRPIRRRVPFDHDQLGIEASTATLLVEAIDECLKALERIAAVVVVPGGDDDAQIWLELSHR